MIQIKDLKVGTLFQMEGLDHQGNKVQANATLRSYNGMNKYVVESDGITILYDGNETVTKVLSL
jgi:hypothetical protein